MHSNTSTVKRQRLIETMIFSACGRLQWLSNMLRYSLTSLIALRFICVVFASHFYSQIFYFAQCINGVLVMWA